MAVTKYYRFNNLTRLDVGTYKIESMIRNKDKVVSKANILRRYTNGARVSEETFLALLSDLTSWYNYHVTEGNIGKMPHPESIKQEIVGMFPRLDKFYQRHRGRE